MTTPNTIHVWHGNPKLEHTGTWATTRYPDDAVEYVRADLARPVTVAEAAKVLPLCKVCNQGVDMQAIGGTVNSNGKYWHAFCYKTQKKLDQARLGWDECAARLRALSHEGGE